MATTTTLVDIWNLALSHLDHGERIESVGENSKARIILSEQWPAARDEMLERHKWKFATRLMALPAHTQTPPFRWTYQYIWPEDMLRLLEIQSEGDYGQEEVPNEPGLWWDSTNDTNIRVIMTDEAAPLNIRGIVRVEDTTLYSPSFVRVAALRLAISTGNQFGRKAATIEALAGLLRDEFPEAAQLDSMQGSSEEPVMEDWVTGRFQTDRSFRWSKNW